jgi:hypothetical protein
MMTSLAGDHAAFVAPPRAERHLKILHRPGMAGLPAMD